MAYDRTRTEKAAFGVIDETHYVECGPLEVPYLSFRKSELTAIEASHEDPNEFFDVMYKIINYRFKDTLPREDFDQFCSIEDVMSYFLNNRSNQKKAVVKD